jgi:hypothetical protein
MVLLPESTSAWSTAPIAVASGAGVLITTSPSLSPTIAALLSARPSLRAVTTPVAGTWLGDDLLGDVSRVLLGLPWAPDGVALAPTPAVTWSYKVKRANGGPEPVKKGKKLTVTSKVTARAAGAKKYAKVPAGQAFAVQFKATGAKKYTTVASARTISGKASAKVKATKSGRWRVVIGSKKSASDYVRVRK